MSDEDGNVRIAAFGVTNVGMVRTNNEDAFIIADLEASEGSPDQWDGERPIGSRGILLAVSDGMGGAAAGEIASAITVESLRHWLHSDHGGLGTHDLIEGAVEEANRNVFDAAQTAERRGMGATLTAILVRGTMAHIAEVGDSRAYLIRDGRIRQVTRDQSYVQLLVEQGMITRDQAERSPYRNVILQAMGQKPEVVVALGRLELRRGDRFLLCSDGLSGKVDDDEMREILASSDNFSDAAGRLVDMANLRGGEDNITVVLAEVSGDGLGAARHGEGITQTLSDVKNFDLGNGSPSQSSAMPAPVIDAKPTHVTAILSAPTSEPAPATAVPAGEPSQGLSVWVLVVVGLIAIIGIVIAAYVLS